MAETSRSPETVPAWHTLGTAVGRPNGGRRQRFRHPDVLPVGRGQPDRPGPCDGLAEAPGFDPIPTGAVERPDVPVSAGGRAGRWQVAHASPALGWVARSHVTIYRVLTRMVVERPMMSEPYRLSDAERDDAVNALSQAYVDGRLSEDEFSERMTAATAATLSSELDPLFLDLPRRPSVPLPTRAAAPRPTRVPRRSSHGRRPRPGFLLLPLGMLALTILLLGGWLPVAILLFVGFKVAHLRAAALSYPRGTSYRGPAYRGCRAGRRSGAGRGGGNW